MTVILEFKCFGNEVWMKTTFLGSHTLNYKLVIEMNFQEWMNYESLRIVSLGRDVPIEHREDYIKVQIVAALHKAFMHGKDRMGLEDEPRPYVPEQK